MNAVSCLRPQTPGGARPFALAPSHKLGRAVALASASPWLVVPQDSAGGAA